MSNKIKIEIEKEQADGFANMLGQINQEFERRELDSGKIEFEFESNPLLAQAICQVQGSQPDHPPIELEVPKSELPGSLPEIPSGQPSSKSENSIGNSQPQARG